MANRFFWFGVGAASGCVAAVWGLTSARRASARLAPDRVSDGVAVALRGVGRDVRAAVAEGRDAMDRRERELSERLGGRRRGNDGGPIA
ncbi:MAG: hypothetical protein U5R31_10270 [Acidimicrobiia bacterium]|nr:hypothetical protein [Acidimicrobiia bacterium]